MKKITLVNKKGFRCLHCGKLVAFNTTHGCRIKPFKWIKRTMKQDG